ncbi:unnamed protein product [Echinostoma caproni]|uniref:MARVEL domain-containing protein n=1 Tax=Echinostoma caproni TaxID=27848 RepID=A0A183B3F4_9TREM|nr:unnamed protein product [Echinostoma caproni]
MSFIKGNIGTGMLSLPVVLRYSGLWFLHSFFPWLWLNYYFVGFMICLILVPMCLCSDMRVFAYLSTVANLATMLGTVLIFAFLFYSGLKPITVFPAIKDAQGVLIGFSVAMCAFEGISLQQHLSFCPKSESQEPPVRNKPTFNVSNSVLQRPEVPTAYLVPPGAI